MSELRQVLLAQLARFDEDAYAALASKGLLRRAQKDLEKIQPAIEKEEADALEMRLGDHLIRFDARGPAHASCSCPAGGVCQHILAAAIGLQRLGAVESPEAADENEAPTLEALAASLLALTRAQLERHGGRAGYRWAWQFVQDAQDDVGISGERHLVIEFQRPRLRLRYMGGGPESLIADVETQHLAKYQVAAVLALRRAHGLDVAPPEPASRAKTAGPALDLGKDHELASSVPDAERASRLRLRASSTRLLEECIELGLSHLSTGIRDRFSTLAVWAQGAQYYRLALLLRRITDHVELLLERAGGADEHRLLDELSLVHALVAALTSAELRGSEPAHLLGRARTEYSAAPSLELLGLGASAWRSGSGYVGLTMLFWSPSEQRFFSCTDARPEIQRGFDPVKRYRASGPWAGLGAPEQATGREVRLTAAQVNGAGRLSASDSAQAVVRAVPALHERLRAIGDWAELAGTLAKARQSLLAEPQPMSEWFVLAPASYGKAQFDAVRQVLSWPLLDREGRAVTAELVFSPYTEHAIRRIEQLASPAQGVMLVGRARSVAGRILVEPLSLVHPGRDNEVDALHFDEAPASSFVSRWLASFRPGSKGPESQTAAPAVAIPREIGALRHWLRQLSERGFDGQAATREAPAVKLHGERCAAAGLMPIAEALHGGMSASRLLVANYLCMQTERLLGRDEES